MVINILDSAVDDHRKFEQNPNQKNKKKDGAEFEEKNWPKNNVRFLQRHHLQSIFTNFAIFFAILLLTALNLPIAQQEWNVGFNYVFGI